MKTTQNKSPKSNQNKTKCNPISENLEWKHNDL